MKQTSNTFTDGLLLDYHPLLVPNTALTDNLNGTFITMNGNEMSLQNDMGNCKIETGKLTPGFIPVGMKEYGGIIYIASVNADGVCELGSFPSPETNLDSDELNAPEITINDNTLGFKEGRFNQKYKILDTIRAGDKFIIGVTSSNLTQLLSEGILSVYLCVLDSGDNLIKLSNLKMMSIQNNSVVEDSTGESYVIAASLEDLKKALNNNNNVFQIYNNKLAGDLYIVFEINTIDNCSLTIDATSSVDGVSNTIDKLEVIYSIPNNLNYKYLATPTIIINGTNYTISGSNGDYTVSNLIFGEDSIDITVIPNMNIGGSIIPIESLTQKRTIVFSEIGSGKFEISNYKYYITDYYARLQLGFNSYPKKEDPITGIQLSFYDQKYNQTFTYDIPLQRDYNTNNIYILNYASLGLILNNYYILTINKTTKNGNITSIKRWFITGKAYNQYYSNPNILDYNANFINNHPISINISIDSQISKLEQPDIITTSDIPTAVSELPKENKITVTKTKQTETKYTIVPKLTITNPEDLPTNNIKPTISKLNIKSAVNNPTDKQIANTYDVNPIIINDLTEGLDITKNSYSITQNNYEITIKSNLLSQFISQYKTTQDTVNVTDAFQPISLSKEQIFGTLNDSGLPRYTAFIGVKEWPRSGHDDRVYIFAGIINHTNQGDVLYDIQEWFYRKSDHGSGTIYMNTNADISQKFQELMQEVSNLQGGANAVLIEGIQTRLDSDINILGFLGRDNGGARYRDLRTTSGYINNPARYQMLCWKNSSGDFIICSQFWQKSTKPTDSDNICININSVFKDIYTNVGDRTMKQYILDAKKYAYIKSYKVPITINLSYDTTLTNNKITGDSEIGDITLQISTIKYTNNIINIDLQGSDMSSIYANIYDQTAGVSNVVIENGTILYSEDVNKQPLISSQMYIKTSQGLNKVDNSSGLIKYFKSDKNGLVINYQGMDKNVVLNAYYWGTTNKNDGKITFKLGTQPTFKITESTDIKSLIG